MDCRIELPALELPALISVLSAPISVDDIVAIVDIVDTMLVVIAFGPG